MSLDRKVTSASLDDHGKRFKTAKYSLEHNYLDAYERLLPFHRQNAFNLIEIGVCRRASAQMWAECFYSATVIAVDLKLAKLKKRPKNLKPITGNATQALTANRFRAKHSLSIVVLNDRCHRWNQQRESFRLLWPWLKEGGVCMAEDLRSSSEAGFSGDDIFPFVDSLLRIGTLLQLRDASREQFLSVSPPWFAEILTDIESVTFLESSAIINMK